MCYWPHAAVNTAAKLQQTEKKEAGEGEFTPPSSPGQTMRKQTMGDREMKRSTASRRGRKESSGERDG